MQTALESTPFSISHEILDWITWSFDRLLSLSFFIVWKSNENVELKKKRIIKKKKIIIINGIESVCSTSSYSSEMSESSATASMSSSRQSYPGMDFLLIVDSKSGGPSKVVHLVAPSMQDKTAWISDISQVSLNPKLINYIRHPLRAQKLLSHVMSSYSLRQYP